MKRLVGWASVFAVVCAVMIVALGGLLVWQMSVARQDADAPTVGTTWNAPASDNASVRSDSSANYQLATTDSVNVRSGPGLDYGVLSVLSPDTPVHVTGSEVNGYLPVDVDGKTYWIAAAYLGEPNQQVSASETTRESDVDQAMVTPTTETSAERWIEVDRSERTVTLHNGDSTVAVYSALMGRDPSTDGFYSTAVGTFHVFSKEKALTETPFAPGVFLTDFVGFDPERSNGFHSPVRDAEGNVVQTGGTVTMGCVRLSAEDAVSVFDFAEIGMRVVVHE